MKHTFLSKLAVVSTLGVMFAAPVATFAQDNGQTMSMMKADKSCVAQAQAKRHAANKTSKASFEAAMKTAKTAYETARRAAKALTNEDQRAEALDKADLALFDARWNAEKAKLTAMIAATSIWRTDQKACMQKQQVTNECVKDARSKNEQSVKTAKEQYELAMKAAKSLTNPSERMTAVWKAEDALRQAKRDAEKVMLDAKTSCNK